MKTVIACITAVSLLASFAQTHVAAAPATQPATRTAELVPLDVRIPIQFYDGGVWQEMVVFEEKHPGVEIPEVQKFQGWTRPKFMVPPGTINLALKKPVTSSDSEPNFGELECVTDGDRGYNCDELELHNELQWVQIDLQRTCSIYVIALWHDMGRTYEAFIFREVVVQVSDDPKFKVGVKTVFNNDRDNKSGLGRGTDRQYLETHVGKWIDAKGVKARYVRLYSNGAIKAIRGGDHPVNSYYEVEVYGLPSK